MNPVKNEGMLLWNLQVLSGASTNEFRSKLLGEPEFSIGQNTQKWMNIKQADYLTSDALKDAKRAVLNKSKWKEQAAHLFRNQTQSDFLRKLISILKKKLKYSLKTPGGKTGRNLEDFLKKNLIPYNDNYKTALIESMQRCVQGKETEFDAMDYAWFATYLAIFKQLPNEFYQAGRLRHDLAEYNEMVQQRYGSVSTPAYRVIVSLANAGNLVAITELGELNYYGRFSQGKPQYKEAYRCFRIAAGELDGSSNIHYPLACWNIAYMMFNYGFRRDLKEAFVSELEEQKMCERQEMAVRYCLTALEADRACVPVYNLLGVILDVLETTAGHDKWARDTSLMIKNSEIVQTIFGSDSITPENFFERASERGYVEASNNLARRECKKTISAKRGSHDQYVHLQKAIEYFERASQNSGTWASNKLGEFYRTGVISVYYEEINSTESVTFETCIDDNKAMYYYEKAMETFVDTHSAWACLHLLESYGDRIDEAIYNRCVYILNIVENKEIKERSNDLLNARIIR